MSVVLNDSGNQRIVTGDLYRNASANIGESTTTARGFPYIRFRVFPDPFSLSGYADYGNCNRYPSPDLPLARWARHDLDASDPRSYEDTVIGNVSFQNEQQEK